MYRATTPTHIFWFNEVDPNIAYKAILITYAQNGRNVLEKTKQDLSFGVEALDEGLCYYASLKLTEEETLLFSSDPNNSIEIQIRAINQEDVACASNKIKIPCLDVLDSKKLYEDSGGSGGDPYSTYRGSYVVLPDFNGRILETENKLMISNVSILPIPVYRTSNLSGGTTVYIGGIISG